MLFDKSLSKEHSIDINWTYLPSVENLSTFSEPWLLPDKERIIENKLKVTLSSIDMFFCLFCFAFL